MVKTLMDSIAEESDKEILEQIKVWSEYSTILLPVRNRWFDLKKPESREELRGLVYSYQLRTHLVDIAQDFILDSELSIKDKIDCSFYAASTIDSLVQEAKKIIAKEEGQDD